MLAHTYFNGCFPPMDDMWRINPEEEARRQRRKELTEMLGGLGVTDIAGVQDLFKELIGTVLENGLEGELDC